MPQTDDSENMAYEGACFSVKYAIDANGKMHAKKALAGNKILNSTEKVKMWAKIETLGDIQEITNDEIFKRERGDIHALKIHKRRFYCFRDGNSWLLTHGVKKNQRKADPKELDRADRIREEYLKRKDTNKP